MEEVEQNFLNSSPMETVWGVTSRSWKIKDNFVPNVTNVHGFNIAGPDSYISHQFYLETSMIKWAVPSLSCCWCPFPNSVPCSFRLVIWITGVFNTKNVQFFLFRFMWRQFLPCCSKSRCVIHVVKLRASVLGKLDMLLKNSVRRYTLELSYYAIF